MEALRFGSVEASANYNVWLSDFRDNTDIPKESYNVYLNKVQILLGVLTPMVDRNTTNGFSMDKAQEAEDLFEEIKAELNSYINRENVEILLEKIHTYIQGVITKVFSINTKEHLDKTEKQIKNAEEQTMNTNANTNTENKIKDLEVELEKASANVSDSSVVEVNIFDKIPGGIYTAAALGVAAAYGIYKIGYLRGYAQGKDESATIIIMDERE